jgi:TfoX/Sxy family transcriptional regulator of competence genes
MSKVPKAPKAQTDSLRLYEKLVATNSTVELKGAAMRYTSLNGHMFSFLTPDGKLALRLPTGIRDEFLKQFKTALCVQHGTVMKEYVEVPQSLLKQTQKLEPFFELSYQYVASLKPKPTTKKGRKG